MSMKGGLAGPKKLIVETDEFFDPPGEGGAGQFSPSRYLSTLLHMQDPVMIDKVVKEFESLLGSLSEVDIKNLYRKLTAELQDPENGLIKLLGAYPSDRETPTLDREASEAEIELMTALTVMDEYGGELNHEEELRTAFKTLLDHAAPALYHFQKADTIFREEKAPDRPAPEPPSFMVEISPDFARKTQQDLNLRPVREIDVTQIINTALGGTSRDTQKFGAIDLLIPPLLSLPDAVRIKRDTRRAFEEKLSAFRDGALGGLEKVRDLIAQIDDPGLKQELETQLQKSAGQRLEEHRTAQITLTQDEVLQLERTVQNPHPEPKRQQAPRQEPEPGLKPEPAATLPLPSLPETEPVVRPPVFPDAPQPEPAPAVNLLPETKPVPMKPEPIPGTALLPEPIPAPKEPEPAPETWRETLQIQVDKNARKALELYDLIKEGPSSNLKEPAQQAAKELASTYTEIQRALQDYKSEETPGRFAALTEALDRLEDIRTPEMNAALVHYDREAARIEAAQRQALEARQQQISFQREPFSPKTPDTPEITAPALFGGSGGMGGGGFS